MNWFKIFRNPYKHHATVRITMGNRSYVLCSAYFLQDFFPPPTSTSSDWWIGVAARICPLFQDVTQMRIKHVCTGLEILNNGTSPTFVTRARQEVLEITLCSRLWYKQWLIGVFQQRSLDLPIAIFALNCTSCRNVQESQVD